MSAFSASVIAACARALAGPLVRWVNCRPSLRQRVYFANHTSHLDFVVLWSVLPRRVREKTRPVAAKDYWNFGLRKRIAVNSFQAVLVERGARDPIRAPHLNFNDHGAQARGPRNAPVFARSGVEAPSPAMRGDGHGQGLTEGDRAAAARHTLELLLEALGTENSLIVFPEGTRGDGLEVGPFKSGIYHLWQRRPDVQFVPVYLSNLNRILPKGEFLPVPVISRVTFGPPLRLEENETKESFLSKAHAAVRGLRAA